MTISLQRMVETPDGTFGELTFPGLSPWYTVERRRGGEHPRIPAGTYQLELSTWHAHGDLPVYEITGVPDRSRILIHPANLASELLGCVALGKRIGFLFDQLAVLDSRAAFKEFMEAMKGSKDYLVVYDEKRA